MKVNRIYVMLFLTLFPRILSADTVQEYTYPLWKLVAESSLIVVGIPHIPRHEIEESLQGNAAHSITFEVMMNEVLKGKTNKESLLIIYYPEESDYTPSPRLLQDLNGKETILFLLEVDDKDSKGFYFAGHTLDALQPFEHEIMSNIKKEVTYQHTVLTRFKKDMTPSDLAHYRRVKTLIHDMTDRKKELDNLKKLEELGHEAVPAIIYLMDDFRRLPLQSISLECPPGWFEALRHYSPDRVVDALAAILNQITGQSFGRMIYNGASKQERKLTIDGWRVYLHYQRLQETQQRENDDS